MADEIEISSTGEDGHAIRGSYRVAAGVIHVTLSDGTRREGFGRQYAAANADDIRLVEAAPDQPPSG